MIRALLLNKSEGVQLLDPNSITAWQPSQGLLWLHFDVDEEATRQWLLSDEHLPQVVTIALLAENSRPRAHAIGDGVQLTLRSINLNPGADPEDMVSIRLWIDADRIISTQRRQLQSLDDVIDSLKEYPLERPGALVVRLIDRMVHHLHDVIENMDERISNLESEATQQSSDLNRSCIAEIRREVITLRRFLAPQHEALRQLYNENITWLTDADKLNLHEAGDRLLHCLEYLEAFRERASVLQAELVSQLSEQLNKRMYVLSIVAAMFLPLGFLTGLLGINLGGIPGAESPFGFLTFALLMFAILGLQLWFFTRNRWFK